MLEMQGFSLKELVKQTEQTALYRGIRLRDQKHVLLKKIMTEPPDLDELKHLQEEYILLTKLPIKDVPKPLEFIDTGKQAAYVVEDEGEILLSQFLTESTLNLKQFLSLAISLTDVISDLHFRGMVHKDIKPSNILINPKKHTIKLINFEAVISFPWRVYAPDALRSSLAYISPEQTGRMNRQVDYRTDFYSLGITLYEMLLGKMPFKATDAIGMVHAHMAKIPEPPDMVNPKIPIMVSNIIMKLLAKIPEERYQSTFGIKADLEQCLIQLKSFGKINAFALAKKDVSEHFIVSHKLYGREKELNVLFKTFQEVTEGKAEFLLVTGLAGIGKSTLINEIHQSVVTYHGYYCASKFDQFERDIPYSVFVNVLKSLVRQIMTENEENIRKWKKIILEKIGDNIQLITNMVPELELIIGKQAAPKIEIDSSDTEVLFYRAVRDFIQLFATEKHPLVIFIDDMQWSNFSSLNLLKHLITSDVKHHFLIIGSYRVDEVDGSHPLSLVLNELQSENIPIKKITLTPLTLFHVQQLIADTFFKERHEVTDLAKLCFEKTQGNPFFINQLLNLMYDEGSIFFEQKSGTWNWDIEKINNLPVTSNVVDLMIMKLEKFSVETKNLLKLAACIGHNFSLDILAHISNMTANDVASKLWPALNEGYILPSDGGISLTSGLKSKFTFKFLHDRVHQAAYALTNDTERKVAHKKIAEALLSGLSQDEIEDNIFYIVNHFNLALELIREQKEKIELAKLNLLAGQKAKESVAFNQSFQNLNIGLTLLSEDAWNNNYDLALLLHTELAYVAYLLNDHAKMESLSEAVFANAKDSLDKMKIYEIKIDAYTKRDKCNNAIRIARKGLRELKIYLPKSFLKLNCLKELLSLKFISFFKSENQIINLPAVSDPKMIAAMRLLIKTMPAAQSKSIELLVLIALKAALLSLKYGNMAFSAVPYAMCAVISWQVGDVRNTVKFTRIALGVVDKFHAKRERGMALFTAACFLQPWQGHLRESLSSLYEAYKIAVDLGEVSYIGFNAFLHSLYQFWCGIDLDKTLNDTHRFMESIAPYKQNIPILSLKLLLQLMINLRKDTVNPTILSGEYMDEESWLAFQSKTTNDLQITAFYLVKMYLCYLFGHYKEAYEYANRINSESFSGMYSYSMIVFYDSLTRLAMYDQVSDKEQKLLLRRVNQNQKIMKKFIRTAPQNFLHKYYLVYAEYARVCNKTDKAIKYYDQAIELAHQNQFLQEEALANELAGKFYLHYNKKIAPCYLQDAYYQYKKWGSMSKGAELEKNYPGIIHEGLHKEWIDDQKLPQALDLSSILKASRVISSEIAFAKMVKKALKIVVENVGADRCVLMLMRNNELYIEGEYANGKFLHILASIPYTESKVLPASIIDYFMRTNEMVKIDDVANDQLFLHDPYLILHKPRSILCYPLFQHGELQGVFYFENKLAINAFTNDRLAMLNSLSAQIVISMENSRLYEAFKRFVPQEFLNLIEKHNVVDVQLGDYVQKSISVMFMDIGGFTALSEKLSPNEVFQFINTYLSYMEPVIADHQGFIDKYIGDGIMALFPEDADDAVNAAIALQEAINNYNENELKQTAFKISARIGINTGPTILGTIGSQHRIDGSVIGDAVNTASRITDLNHLYGATILISEHTKSMLKNPDKYHMRMIDKVKVKGKSEIISIWQILVDPKPLDKTVWIQTFKKAWDLYAQGDFERAEELFQDCLRQCPDDKVSEYFAKRCKELIKIGAPKDWAGVTILTSTLHF